MSQPVKHLLYYIPGLKNAKEAKAKVVEVVGNSLVDSEIAITNCDGGPDKSGPGVLCAAYPKWASTVGAEVEKRLVYCADPAKQVWIEAKGYWVGYHVDLKPNADDLQRERMVSGYRYECPLTGDWVVPLARKSDGTTMFDQRVAYMPDGTITKKPVARYKTLCDFASDHWEFLVGLEADEKGIEFEADKKYCDVACEALGVNYHVGPYELTLLEVLTMESAGWICGYLCDIIGLLEITAAKRDAAKKNKETESSSTINSGEAVA